MKRKSGIRCISKQYRSAYVDHRYIKSSKLTESASLNANVSSAGSWPSKLEIITLGSTFLLSLLAPDMTLCSSSINLTRSLCLFSMASYKMLSSAISI